MYLLGPAPFNAASTTQVAAQILGSIFVGKQLF